MENIGKMDSRVLNVDVRGQTVPLPQTLDCWIQLTPEKQQPAQHVERRVCREGTVVLRGGLPPEVFSRYIISKHLLVFTALFAALFGYPGGDTLLTIQAT